MRRVTLIIASALSSPAAANTTECGENAFTFAEVVEARPASLTRARSSRCRTASAPISSRTGSRASACSTCRSGSPPQRRRAARQAGAAGAFRRASAEHSPLRKRRGVTSLTTVSKVCAIGSVPAAFAPFCMPAGSPPEAPHGRLIIRDNSLSGYRKDVSGLPLGRSEISSMR